MNETVKVYVKTKAVCGPCIFTKKKLNELNIPYEELVGEDHIEEIQELGFNSFPVVVTTNHGNWSGHNEDKLKELAVAIAG